MQQIVQIGNFSYYSSKAVGHGATGSVYLGFRNQDKMPVAVKAIKLNDVNTPVKKHLLDCEVSALKKIKNRYVCQAFDVLKDGQYYFVPMEYCPNGTLRDYIKSKVKMNESEALSMFQKVLEGYCAIRQAGFVHRDLKSQNILLRPNMDPAIIDFGYCEKTQTQNQRLTYNVGSPAYMSPQAYNDSIYNQKSDIWALGIVLHEMLTGTIPIMRTKNVDEYFNYLKNMKTAEIIPVPGQNNQLLIKILMNCLTVDPRLRYNAEELQKMIRNQMNNGIRTKSNSTNFVMKQIQQTNVPMQRVQSSYQQKNQNYQTTNNGFRSGSEKNYSQKQEINQTNSNFSNSNNTSNTSNMGNKCNGSPVLNQQERRTLPPNFSNLRKRIQTTQFNLNIAPIKNDYQQTNQNSNIIYRQQQRRFNEIMTPMTSIKKITSTSSNSSGSPLKMRKATSSQNISVPLRFY